MLIGICEQMAGQICRIFASSFKWSAIWTACRNLYLLYGIVLQECDWFDAALSAVARTVRMPMIENVPLSVRLHHAAMIITAVVHGLVCWLVGIDM
ncbi:hypothetical protein D3C81_1696120 [compost metagenome]